MAVTRIVSGKDIARIIKQTDARIQRAVKNAIVEAAAVGAEIVARDAPVDTGRLKQSVVMRRRGPSGHPEIIAQAPHAGPVEVGSPPHWVPIRPLEKWVKRHLSYFNVTGAPAGRTTGRANRKARRAARARSTVAVLRIAHAIQWKIARFGTKPRWYMRKNLPRLRAVLNTLMRESKAKALRSLGDP